MHPAELFRLHWINLVAGTTEMHPAELLWLHWINLVAGTTEMHRAVLLWLHWINLVAGTTEMHMAVLFRLHWINLVGGVMIKEALAFVFLLLVMCLAVWGAVDAVDRIRERVEVQLHHGR